MEKVPDRFLPLPSVPVWRHPWHELADEEIVCTSSRRFGSKISVQVRFAYAVDRFKVGTEKMAEEVIVEAIAFRFLLAERFLADLELEAEPDDLLPLFPVFERWMPEQVLVSRDLDQLVFSHARFEFGFVVTADATHDKIHRMRIRVTLMPGEQDELCLLSAEDDTLVSLRPYLRTK